MLGVYNGVFDNSSVLWATFTVLLIFIFSYFGIKRFLTFRKESRLPDIMISLASGIMITILFLHLLREVYEAHEDGPIYTVIIALFVFFVLSLVNHSHSHDSDDGHKDTVTVHISKSLMVIGQGVHSLADGIVIISGWIVSPITGILTSLAVALHHIPMLIGISNKYKNIFSKKFIFVYTMYASLAMLLGILFAKVIYTFVAKEYFIAIAAASFAHIAILDMFGHVRESKFINKKTKIFFILLGIVLAYISEMSHAH